MKPNFPCGHPREGNTYDAGAQARCLICKKAYALAYYHDREVKKGKNKERKSSYKNPFCLLERVWK